MPYFEISNLKPVVTLQLSFPRWSMPIDLRLLLQSPLNTSSLCPWILLAHSDITVSTLSVAASRKHAPFGLSVLRSSLYTVTFCLPNEDTLSSQAHAAMFISSCLLLDTKTQGQNKTCLLPSREWQACGHCPLWPHFTSSVPALNYQPS